METLETLQPLAIFLVLYTGFIFWVFGWMLKSQTEPIKELLSNHITDTNKKIEDTNKKIDDLRIDTNKQIEALRIDTNKQIEDLRTEMKDLRVEIKEDLKEIKSMIKSKAS